MFAITFRNNFGTNVIWPHALLTGISNNIPHSNSFDIAVEVAKHRKPSWFGAFGNGDLVRSKNLVAKEKFSGLSFLFITRYQQRLSLKAGIDLLLPLIPFKSEQNRLMIRFQIMFAQANISRVFPV